MFNLPSAVHQYASCFVVKYGERVLSTHESDPSLCYKRSLNLGLECQQD